MTTIIKLNKPRFRSRVAFFDYDHTLVIPKSGGIFPKDIDDWKWIRPNVPEIVKQFYHKGYAIYIVTNQSKPWKKDQIQIALETLDIPLTICIAFDKTLYKPNPHIYKKAIGDKQLKKESFMCGDAMGRPNDHSDCDLKFAEAIGITCISPEELFPIQNNNLNIKISDKQELIVMVGFMGSGKSYISATIFEPAGYFIVHGDEFKTTVKMIKAATEPIKQGKSIVFDATNPSIKKRFEYIEIAKKYTLPIRCVHVNTNMVDSMGRNNIREKPVPKIAYYIYNKNFELPTEDEGFDDVITI